MPSKPITTDIKTLTVNNFNGRLTRARDGDINSGMANFYTSWGYDCFQETGTLIFNEVATSIKGSIITDLIMAGKVRVESGITYLYCIGHLKRLYKIQVNNPATKNPDYDTPVLITTLANSQTFLYGASLDFFQGASEKIWIGHDQGVTKINFDGTGEALVGTTSPATWISNVPRQSVQFVGALFFTNGSNLAKIDSTEAVSTYTAISPGFPSNSQARDLDLTADGRYIVSTITRNPIGDVTSVTPDSSSIASTPSLLAYWNGTDIAASSSTSFPSFMVTAYHTFGSYEYLFGYQIGGAFLASPRQTILVDEFTNPPLPNALASSGDFLGWMTTKFNTVTGHTQAVLSLYGTLEQAIPIGQYRQLLLSSTLTNGDIIRVPFVSTVSSWANAGSSTGYTTAPFQLYGTGKTYFSTLEYDGNTTSYNFYRYKNVVDFLDGTNTGIYETQHQPMPKRVKPIEVRVYFEPNGASSSAVSFKIDLIGISGAVLTGGTYTFSSSNQITATADTASYPCSVGPTAYLGLRITNVGSVTPFIHKVEIDYTSYGN